LKPALSAPYTVSTLSIAKKTAVRIPNNLHYQSNPSDGQRTARHLLLSNTCSRLDPASNSVTDIGFRSLVAGRLSQLATAATAAVGPNLPQQAPSQQTNPQRHALTTIWRDSCAVLCCCCCCCCRSRALVTPAAMTSRKASSGSCWALGGPHLPLVRCVCVALCVRIITCSTTSYLCPAHVCCRLGSFL
jgi:hypothetical protein